MPMKVDLEMSSKSEFDLRKYCQLKIYKNVKLHYINTYSQP